MAALAMENTLLLPRTDHLALLTHTIAAVTRSVGKHALKMDDAATNAATQYAKKVRNATTA